jgi:hypothetical protein
MPFMIIVIDTSDSSKLYPDSSIVFPTQGTSTQNPGSKAPLAKQARGVGEGSARVVGQSVLARIMNLPQIVCYDLVAVGELNNCSSRDF